jgi:type II secretory pathway component HofQ
MRTLVRSLLLALALAPLAAAQDRGRLDRDRLVELIQETAAAEAESRLDRTGEAETAEDRAVAREVRRTLAGLKVTVNFEQTPVLECFDFLRDVTGLNIVLSKAAVEALEDKKVTLRLKSIRLKNCLELLLQQVDPDLRYGVRHGVLTIALKDEWRRSMVLELYFVGDLVDPIPDFPGPKMGIGPDGATFEY